MNALDPAILLTSDCSVCGNSFNIDQRLEVDINKEKENKDAKLVFMCFGCYLNYAKDKLGPRDPGRWILEQQIRQLK